MTEIRNSPSGQLKTAGGGGGITPPAGQLDGTVLDPLVVGITESGGAELDIVGVANGTFLKRVGTTIAGTTPTSTETTNASTVVPGATVTDSQDALAGVVNDLSGSASQTLALTDAFKYVRVSFATAVSLHVPANATVAFPIGTLIVVCQSGAGALTLVADGATVLNKPASKSLVFAEQYSQVALKKVATDTWDVVGGLT